MKKILLIFAICTVCGCETQQVKEVEIKGHIYLIFDGYHKGNIIHAEHCPCKKIKK